MEVPGGETVTSWRREVQLTGRTAVAEMKGVNEDSDLKMGRGSEHSLPKKTYGWPTGTWKDTQHCSSSGKCKSKPGQSGYHPKDRKLQVLLRKSVEKRDPSGATGGGVIWGSLFGKWCARPQKIKTTQGHCNSTFGHLSEGNRNIDWKRSLRPHIPCSITDNSQDLETT